MIVVRRTRDRIPLKRSIAWALGTALGLSFGVLCAPQPAAAGVVAILIRYTGVEYTPQNTTVESLHRVDFITITEPHVGQDGKVFGELEKTNTVVKFECEDDVPNLSDEGPDVDCTIGPLGDCPLVEGQWRARTKGKVESEGDTDWEPEWSNWAAAIAACEC